MSIEIESAEYVTLFNEPFITVFFQRYSINTTIFEGIKFDSNITNSSGRNWCKFKYSR